MALKDKAKKKTKLSFPDLSEVEGRRTLLPEDTYKVKITGVRLEEGAKGDYYAWEFQVIEGSCKGSKLWYNTSLSENSLWNLRGLLEAAGIEIPDSAFELEPSELMDLELMVDVEHEEYEGKDRAKIVNYHPIEEGEEKEEEEVEVEEDDKKGKKDEEEEEVDGHTEEEINGMSLKELADVVKTRKLKVDLDEYKSTRRKQAAVIAALEEAGLLVEEA